MPQEAFCPEHGPYDASLGACPYPHAGSPRPGMPISLEDDLPTDIYGGRTAPTLPPGGKSGGHGGDEEGATELPAARRGGRGILDFDEEEATELPRRGRGDDDEIDKTELVEPVSVTQGMLWVRVGPRRGKFYPIKHGTVVGRKEGSLLLDDPKVSARHAKFTIEDDDFILWDLASANGTYVNDKKIREATVLNENDTIRIGETVFVIKMLDPRPKKKSTGGRKPKKSVVETEDADE